MPKVIESFERIVEAIPPARRGALARDRRRLEMFLAAWSEFNESLADAGVAVSVRVPGRAWEAIRSAGLARMTEVAENRTHGKGYTVVVSMASDTARTVARFCKERAPIVARTGDISQAASLKTTARRIELALR